MRMLQATAVADKASNSAKHQGYGLWFAYKPLGPKRSIHKVPKIVWESAQTLVVGFSRTNTIVL